MNSPGLQATLFRNFTPFIIVSSLLQTGLISVLVSNPAMRYKTPNNFIFLGIITFLQSITVGIFSSIVGPKVVCLGTMHTLATFLAVTIYSFQDNPKFDLTPLGNILLTSLVSLLVGSLLNIFFKMPLIDNLISGGLAVLMATYIAYDTQMIVGGKHKKYSYSPKEYILATLNLYVDVMNLFIQILSILSKLERGKNRRKENDEY